MLLLFKKNEFGGIIFSHYIKIHFSVIKTKALFLLLKSNITFGQFLKEIISGSLKASIRGKKIRSINTIRSSWAPSRKIKIFRRWSPVKWTVIIIYLSQRKVVGAKLLKQKHGALDPTAFTVGNESPLLECL